jgi:hypothetical protein
VIRLLKSGDAAADARQRSLKFLQVQLSLPGGISADRPRLAVAAATGDALFQQTLLEVLGTGMSSAFAVLDLLSGLADFGLQVLVARLDGVQLAH